MIIFLIAFSMKYHFLLNIVSITDTDHASERCQAMCVEMAYRTESCDMYKLMSHN